MSKHFGVLLLLTCVGIIGAAQTGAVKTSSAKTHDDEVKTQVVAAYQRNAIRSISAPYHLLATFETFTSEGDPFGKGTIERFAATPNRMKTVVTFRGHTKTEYMTDGKPLYTDDGFSGSIMSYFAEEFLFFSLVPPQGILKREIETSAMTVEGDPLDCGLFQFELWPRFPQSPPKDAFCISQATGDMVLKQTQTFSVRYADFEPFLNHSVPRSITASKGRQVRCRIQVSKLEQWNTDDAALAAPAEASSVSPAPNKWSTDNSEITPIDAKFTSPPAAPMGTYVNGPVALIILISRTGVVSDVESLMAPNPETALYAASLVRHWTYKPILRDGRPIEDITDAFLNLKFQIAPIAASSGAKQ